MSADQRRFPRKQVSVEIRARGRPATGELSFDSADISLGGAFLVSDILYDEGETLDLELRLDGTPPVRAMAHVAWSRRIDPDGVAGMGVSFDGLDEASRRALEAFLRAVP